MPHLDLSDDEAGALTRELTNITWNDRYPLSPRVQTPKPYPPGYARSRLDQQGSEGL